jgi:hypothetical protein
MTHSEAIFPKETHSNRSFNAVARQSLTLPWMVAKSLVAKSQGIRRVPSSASRQRTARLSFALPVDGRKVAGLKVVGNPSRAGFRVPPKDGSSEPRPPRRWS